MFFYRIPQPNEAMLIAGRRHGGPEGPGYKIVVGQGAYVFPAFKRAYFLDMSLHEAELAEDCVSTQGIPLKVQAVAVFKVGPQPELIAAAAQRFLDQQDQMDTQVGRIFAGHLRQIVGQMTIEDIIRERDKLVSAVKESSASECEKLGLIVDSFQIQTIDDPTGYIANLAAPHQAAVEAAARVAAAQQNQQATLAEQEAAAVNAENTAASSKRQAQASADIETAKQTAGQAGPLAEARAQQEVIKAQTANQKLEAERQQAALRATRYAEADADAYATRTRADADKAARIAAAEAEAEAIRIRGQAEGDALTAKANAMAQHRDALIAQQLVEQLPDVVRAAAEPLGASNLTVLNGADGLNQVLGGLLTAGMTMLNRVQSGLPDGARDNGQVPGLTEGADASSGQGGADGGGAPAGRRPGRPNRSSSP